MGKKKTLSEVLADFQKVHGNKYDYSKVEYINARTPVTIICREHGEFSMMPNDHKRGKGCSECSNKKKLTTEEFIRKAKLKHGDIYDYSKTVVNGNNKSYVTITCPIHGDFEQRINNHLNGHGCIKCKLSKLEQETAKLLNANGIKFEQQQVFNWLKLKKHGCMSLDFYLNDYNITIECQGIQHYEPNVFYTKEMVNETQQRDKLKYQLCKSHGIQIHYIKYNENVEESINTLLKQLNQ